ncbi:MAG: 50S ribosomal protein L29 [Flavobacteriales bacterium]
MKASVIKQMTTEEVKERIAGEQANLEKYKINHSISPLETPLVIRTTRRTIARLNTELRARQK